MRNIIVLTLVILSEICYSQQSHIKPHVEGCECKLKNCSTRPEGKVCPGCSSSGTIQPKEKVQDNPGDKATLYSNGNENQVKKNNDKNVTAVKPKKTAPDSITVIGEQKWATRNLAVTKFRNGDNIPEVKNNAEWNLAEKEHKPAWCYYNNDPTNKANLVILYNWYAVIDKRGLAPNGWHIPSGSEMRKLQVALGGEVGSGLKLKDKQGWDNGGNGINEFNFCGLPCGFRSSSGEFLEFGKKGMWWSTDEYTSYGAKNMRIESSNANLIIDGSDRGAGLSVRCIKD